MLRRDEIMKKTDKAFGGSYIFSERGKRTSAISNKKETKRFFAKNRQNSEKQQLQLKNEKNRRRKLLCGKFILKTSTTICPKIRECFFGKRRMEKEESRKETQGEFSVKTFLAKQAEHFFLGIVYL